MSPCDVFSALAVDELLPQLAHRREDAVALKILGRGMDDAPTERISRLIDDADVSWEVATCASLVLGAVEYDPRSDRLFFAAEVRDALRCFAGFGLHSHPGVAIGMTSEDPLMGLDAGCDVVRFSNEGARHGS